jgi:hypothetical protein
MLLIQPGEEKENRPSDWKDNIMLLLSLINIVRHHEDVTSALDRGGWPASRFGRFSPWKNSPGRHCIREWVDPRAYLVVMEKKKKSLAPASKWITIPRSSSPKSSRNRKNRKLKSPEINVPNLLAHFKLHMKRRVSNMVTLVTEPSL